MDISTKEIRKNAKQSRINNKSALRMLYLSMFLISLLSVFISMIPFVGILVQIWIMFLGIGLQIYTLKLYRNENPSLSDFTSVFDNKKIGMYLKVVVGLFIFFIAVYGGVYASVAILAWILSFLDLSILSVAVLIIATITIDMIIIYILTMFSYIIYFMAFDAKVSVSVSDIFSLSNKLVKGNRKKVFFIDLRYFLKVSLISILMIAIVMLMMFNNGIVWLFTSNFIIIYNIMITLILYVVFTGRLINLAGLYDAILANFDDEFELKKVYDDEFLLRHRKHEQESSSINSIEENSNIQNESKVNLDK